MKSLMEKKQQSKDRSSQAKQTAIERQEFVAAAVEAARNTLKEEASDELMELRKKHRK